MAGNNDAFAAGHGGAGGAGGDGFEETDDQIVERLKSGVKQPAGLTNTLGEKAVFVGGKVKEDDPLRPFKDIRGNFIDKRNGQTLPKEKWKWPQELKGATQSAPAPGKVSTQTLNEVDTIRKIRSKGGFKPSMSLTRLGGSIMDAINKLHSFAAGTPTSFHEYYGNHTNHHVSAAFDALDKAKNSVAQAQSLSTHSPGMAGNHLMDAAMAVHTALGHLTQPAIYRRFNGKLPEGVTHDTTEGLISAAAEHSYGVSGPKSRNKFDLHGDFDGAINQLDSKNPEHLKALAKFFPNATPEQQDILRAKMLTTQPSTVKPSKEDPEFEKKTRERAEEQESIEQGFDVVANPRGAGTIRVPNGRGNKVAKGNVGNVVDPRQASRMADGTRPAGGTTLGADYKVTLPAASEDKEAKRKAEFDAQQEIAKAATAKRKEAEAKRAAWEASQPKPEKGPKKSRTSRPKPKGIDVSKMTLDQILKKPKGK